MPFEKGKSGNPGGRPKMLAEWRESLEAKRLRDVAYQTLEKVCKDDRAPAKDRAWAADKLLDRIEGKPIQAIEMSGPDGKPIETRAERLERLSPDQLRQLREIAKQARGDEE